MPVGQEVDIPHSVLVRCPMVKFDLRAARKCDGCVHFGGLTEKLAGELVRFHQRFAVNCKFGQDRDLFQLAVEPEGGIK